jgi:hypothetical protein
VPPVPAICRDCGAVFAAPNIFQGEALNVTMIGNTVSPCPRCGGTGEIPDGVYDFVGDTIRVVANSGYSRQQLERLAALVAQARGARTPAAEVVATLEREAPELSELAKRLLVPKTPADLAGWLMLLLMVLQIFLARPSPDISEKEVERLTEQAVERATQQQPAPSAPSPPSAGGEPTSKRPPPPPRKQRRSTNRRKKQGR